MDRIADKVKGKVRGIVFILWCYYSAGIVNLKLNAIRRVEVVRKKSGVACRCQRETVSI